MNNLSRLFKNFFPLFLLKAFEYLVPLIVVPYLVTTLGVGGFGTMSIALSTAYFLAMVTNYGFELTATREIAINKTNLKKVSKIYSTVFTTKLLLLLLSFLLLNLGLIILNINKGEWFLIYTAFTYVIGSALFPVWLFQGLEKMKYITIINIIPRIIFTLLLFILVKQEVDIMYAVLLQSTPLALSGIISVFIIKRNLSIRYKFPEMKDIASCLKSGFSVFLSSFMTFILASSAVLFLGFFANREVVGAYSALEKLIKAVISLFNPVFQVLFPFISEKFNESEDLGKQSLIQISKVLIPLTILITVIIITNSREILLVMYGNEYIKFDYGFKLLTFWFLFSIINNVVGIQYLIGSGRQKIYTFCFVITALATLILFCILIPLYGLYGAILTVVIGELVLTVAIIIAVCKLNFLNKKLFYTK
ncbi:oligosaccharide flippase family protein [Priestia aryabhattai]|uniref:oligosaccharide flippase family protein n=1 Tax=Priestia aryabhattai TaxID=412384 RepID=UPI003D2922A9